MYPIGATTDEQILLSLVESSNETMEKVNRTNQHN